MKKVIYLFVGLLTLMFVSTSCESSDDPVVEPVAQLGDVTFDVTNFITQLAAKDGELKDSLVCSDLTPDFVYVKINGDEYELDLVTLATTSGGMQSETLKLAPGDYTIEEFAVYNGTANNGDDTDDTVLFASPEDNSVYVTNWGMIGVNESFTVEAFKKAPVAIDVLCYVPSAYEEFGFTWMQFDKFKSKKIYFFGDVCTKFWEEWKDYDSELNPYSNVINGYDFPAAFTVDVYVGTDTTPGTAEVSGTYNPADYLGIEAEPLCIEYVDNLQSIDETYTFVISLTLPDGSAEEIYTGTFTDSNWSMENPTGTEDTTLNFGGLDGIFDFVVGNCSYEGNDASMELPAWIPIPKRINATLTTSTQDSYWKITVNSINGSPIANQLEAGGVYKAWCGDINNTIGGTKDFDLYSSLDDLPAPYDTYGSKINVLNWIINHVDFETIVGTGTGQYTKDQIQNGFWDIIHERAGSNTFLQSLDASLSGTIATIATEITEFVPTVGDLAVVLLDPDETGSAQKTMQLLFVRVDP